MLRRLDDGSSHVGDVLRQAAVANGILCDELQEVRPRKEALEDSSVCQPWARRIEAIAKQPRVGRQQRVELTNVAAIDGGDGPAEKVLLVREVGLLPAGHHTSFNLYVFRNGTSP